MGTQEDRIFIYGAGGHAKVVIDAVERAGRQEIVFILDDDPSRRGETFFSYPVIGGREETGEVRQGIVAIGDNAARREVGMWFEERGIRLATALHPSSVLSRGVRVGEGSVLLAGTVINADSRIGKRAIINTGATVDHDCDIGEDVHLAPGTTLCGNVTVGRGAFLGAGTRVIPGIRIGERAVIGAGSTVIRDVADGARMAGSPLKPMD